MNKEELKQYIDQNVYENQDGDITGESLNAVLKAIVDDGGTQVEANPTGEATETLEKLKIGETIYTAPQGEPGTPSYLHLAYAPTIPQYSYEMHYVYQPGDKYIGIRVDNTAGVPSLPENYTWMKFIGDDGTNGAPGINGTNAYVHIMYAQNQPTQDSDMHAVFTSGDKYIGIYAGPLSTAPTSYGSYTWAKFVGNDGQGTQGQPGPAGPANVLSIGTVTDGEQASASVTGEAPNQQLNLVLPKGEQGDPGQNAINPFKGWFDAITTGTAGTDLAVTDEDGELVDAYPNPVVGDYAYIKTWDIDTSTSPQTETPIVKIYECNTEGSWVDSGREFNSANDQTFASGQQVSNVRIVNNFESGGADNVLSAAKTKEFYDEVFGEAVANVYTKADADVYRMTPGSSAESANGTRLRVVLRVLPGDTMSASCPLGKGVAASVYLTLNEAKLAQANYLQTISYTYQETVSGTIEYEGYLAVSLCKSDESAFSDADKAAYLEALSLTLTRIQREQGLAAHLYELDGKLYGGTRDEQYTKADATVYKIRLGNEVNTSPNRLRVVIQLRRGDTMSASCSLGKGVAASVYDTLANAKRGQNNYLQTISYTYQETVSGTIDVDGYLTVSLAKVDDENFTDEEIAQYLSALTLSGIRAVEFQGDIDRIDADINELREEISETTETAGMTETTEIFIGQIVQKGLTATGLDNGNDKRVSMASCIVVPKEQATLKFKLPDGYAVGIRSGDTSRNLSNNNYWFANGSTFTFGSNVHYYRLCFCHYEGDLQNINTLNYLNITVSEIVTMLDNGDIGIYVTNWDNDVIMHNYDNEKYVKAAMRKFISGASNNGSLHKMPVFAHTSDVHGDASRFNNFLDYCDYIGVDAALVSGDCVATDPVDSMQYINDIMDSHNSKVLISTGNHDTVGLQTAQGQYETVMGHCIEKYSGIITNSSESYPTYYYYDFADKNIRLISINLYETNHTDHQCNFTQTQCNWLIATLAATPANYGVLIMFHSPESRPTKDNDYASFYQDILNWTGYHVGLTGDVFRQIIDAFIGKETTNITYTSKGTTITVSADFSNVASGVEFIAYVNGHLHVDEIGYIAGATHKQLNLNVNCGVAVYGSTYLYLANNSDLPRGCDGATQDCFNVYCIDRSAKTVRVAKVGSNITGSLNERKYLAIPYAE